jgi:hypothetical protein
MMTMMIILMMLMMMVMTVLLYGVDDEEVECEEQMQLLQHDDDQRDRPLTFLTHYTQNGAMRIMRFVYISSVSDRQSIGANKGV